jgi:hypothetical protein
MGVKCLGMVTLESAGFSYLAIVMQEIKDDDEIEKRLSTKETLRLGNKHYAPMTDKGEVDNSENRCKVLIEQSKTEPLPVLEIGESVIQSEMENRLWVFDGKLYQSSRNDYSQKQIYLLILDLIDKEKKKFQSLEEKFQKK